MPKKELPFIVEQMEKAVVKDVQPTLHLLGKIFFSSWPTPSPPPPPRPAARSSKPLKLPPGHQIIVHKPAERSSFVKPKEVIIDADFVEDPEFSRGCPTCGGNGKLGRPGHEVSCPSCTARCP